MTAEFELFQIIQARDGLCPLLRPVQGRQQQRREDGDDGDDDEQFNQGEGLGQGHRRGLPKGIRFFHKIWVLAG